MKRAALFLPALALAACGQQSSTTTTTTATGNTTSSTTTTPSTSTGLPTAASLGIQPGKWETTIAVTDIQMSGMPAGMKVPQPTPTKVTTCITPEQAAKGPGDFLQSAGGQCSATTANYGGGKIDVAMTCTMPTGTLTTKTTGTYSPTTMTSDAEATMTGKMSMTEKVHTEARRIGDCG